MKDLKIKEQGTKRKPLPSKNIYALYKRESLSRMKKKEPEGQDKRPRKDKKKPAKNLSRK